MNGKTFKGVDIRLAREADLKAILDIYNTAIATTATILAFEPHSLPTRKDWFDAKQASHLPVFVADDAGEVVGFATYGPFRAWPAYKYTVENSVYVAERARRAGIARALMHRLIDRAREQEYHSVIAGIVADNIPSLRLHQSLGFVEVAHLQEVGYKFGRWIDLKLLQLLLPTPLNTN